MIPADNSAWTGIPVGLDWRTQHRSDSSRIPNRLRTPRTFCPRAVSVRTCKNHRRSSGLYQLWALAVINIVKAYRSDYLLDPATLGSCGGTDPAAYRRWSNTVYTHPDRYERSDREAYPTLYRLITCLRSHGCSSLSHRILPIIPYAVDDPVGCRCRGVQEQVRVLLSPLQCTYLFLSMSPRGPTGTSDPREHGGSLHWIMYERRRDQYVSSSR